MSIFSFLKNLFAGGSAAPAGENLSGQEFKTQLQNSPRGVLLDVRTAAEFSGGTLLGAKNVDFLSSNFAQKVGKLDKNVTYFIFCRSGNRSANACRVMRQMGFEVRNLLGGIRAFPR